jgi:mRNA-degrading endonuclease RelE of RelBE toxin-antitoxin system
MAMFKLIYAPEVKEHLLAIDKKHHSLIRKRIEEQLTHKPNAETRNRKPLEKTEVFGSAWELRFGQGNRFRVFYEINVEESEVVILAIGVKEGNKLHIAGEEIEL